jgi:hypothetical protein
VEILTGGAGRRLGEHRRTNLCKRRAWRALWVVPLSPEMPAFELVILERSLIRQHRPVGNLQHATLQKDLLEAADDSRRRDPQIVGCQLRGTHTVGMTFSASYFGRS